MDLVVIVTGAGGPAGVSVIRELQRLGHRTIGVDASPDAVGIRLADHGATIPLATDASLSDALNRVADDYGATTLISTIPDEMMTLRRLEMPHWFPSVDALIACTDKWAFYQAMKWAGEMVPDTVLDIDKVDIPRPWIIKPRLGSGSRGIRRTDNRLLLYPLTHDGDIVQTEITGREFTADCLIGHGGELIVCVPRWRLETRGGISTRGETFVDDEVVKTCHGVLNAVGLTGVANVQGFVTDIGVMTIEVNPRFSGGLPLSLHAGADIVGQYLNGIHGLPMETQSYKSHTKMARFFDEVFYV